MSLILALETATEISSVALIHDDEILGSETLNLRNSHSSHLAKMVLDLSNYSGIEIKDLKAVAVSEGPGSYTGLRIGTSFAKGICFSNNIPLISINTLSGMAKSISDTVDENHLICPMIDARRMEVYSNVVNTSLETVADTTNVIVDANSYKDQLENHVVHFIGNAVAKCRPVLEHHPNARFIDQTGINAENIAKLASEKYLRSEFENIAYFEPFYLKEYQAGKPKKSLIG